MPQVPVGLSIHETEVDLLRRVTGAALRAVAARPDLTVSFGAGNATVRGANVKLQAPPKKLRPEDVIHLRGAADVAALRIRYHDDTKHTCMPSGFKARQVYEALESARIETVGSRHRPGVAANIAAVMEQRYCAKCSGPIAVLERLPLHEAIHFIARQQFTGILPPNTIRPMLDLWRPMVEAKAGIRLKHLAAYVDDQRAFALELRRLITDLDLADDESDEETVGEEMNVTGSSKGQVGVQPKGKDGVDEGQPSADELQEQKAQREDPLPAVLGVTARNSFGLSRRRSSIMYGPKDANKEAYRIYTTRFDQEGDVGQLCQRGEISSLRAQLDKQLTGTHGMVTKLANRLQRKLMAQQATAWEFDLEEGTLDSSRLAGIVANPMNGLSFKAERKAAFRDTVVSLLIDNSSSMRGRPITLAAMSADILARTLERCGVKVEILGFTTAALKGGQAREKWLADNMPSNPGRLNDLLHIIYKAADVPWRHARENLGLMLQEKMLKENIDGEALLWAHRRLIARPEQRRILLVISDGAPADDSTMSVHGTNYLEKHLRSVIAWIEDWSPVELSAIGIGHDVTRYYRRAVTIRDADELGGSMLRQLSALFDE